MLTRAMAKELSATLAHECLFVDFLSKEEPKKVSEALKHLGWVDSIQELEAIRIFLAFATYMNFTVYQMDMKSAFLNGKLKKEVYVKQPPGFKSNEFPNHVCKLDKALYGLKQALRACRSGPFQLRMKAFPLSLSKGAKEWWMNEGNGNSSTWDELVKKFFKKFYPLSCASNYDKMCDDNEEDRYPLEFIPWRNSKFKDHKKVDEMTKRALLYTWIEIEKKEGLLNDEVSSDEEWEKQEYGNPPKDSFPKPYFEMDKNNHNENNRNTYESSGMDLSGAPQSENINNEQPNEGVVHDKNLVESNSPEFDHNFDIEEQSEEEVRETMTKTMEQYMSKTRENYWELRDNTFSGSEHEDANEHIEKVLEIVDLFHIPKVTQDQIMLRSFPVSLTGAASRWLRNQPSGSITTWEMSKVLQERGFVSLSSSTETNLRDQVKSISTAKADFSGIRRIGCGPDGTANFPRDVTKPDYNYPTHDTMKPTLFVVYLLVVLLLTVVLWNLPGSVVRTGIVVVPPVSVVYYTALDDGVVLVKRCGYFSLNWSSRSHVNSGPLLEFHRTLTNGIRLRFNPLLQVGYVKRIVNLAQLLRKLKLCSTASSSSTQNMSFVSSQSTSSTNDVKTTYGISTSYGHNSQKEGSSSYNDELNYSFFANQSSGPKLDHEDLEQVVEFNLEEMDLKWQVAMISMRLKKFYKNTGRKLQFDAKEPVGFDKTKKKEETGKQEEPKALVTIDGDGVDWTGYAEDEQENFALMAYSNSGSNTEVTSCSKECEESYAKLKKLYDEQREQLDIRTVRDLVLESKMIWCGEVGGVEADLSVSMPLYSQFEGTGSSVDTAKGSAEAGCSSSSLSSSSFSTSLSSLSSSDDSLS
ncbi:ribonuclease H-like domain-containing protein [Tanacetum coccineum]